MKKIYSTIKFTLITAFLSFSSVTKAQVPANDNCINAITITPDTIMNFTTHSMVGVTKDLTASYPNYCVSGGTPYGTPGSPRKELFFKFVATDYLHNIIVEPTVANSWAPLVMLLNGSCAGGFTIVDCATLSTQTSASQHPASILPMRNLTPGQTYYISVTDPTNANTGSFNIMVTKININGDANINARPITINQTNAISNFFVSESGEIGMSPGTICANTLENGKWFKFVAPLTGPYTVTFNNMQYWSSTKTAVGHQIGFGQLGSGPNPYTPITCDSSDLGFANFNLNLTSGITYLMVLEGDLGCLITADLKITSPMITGIHNTQFNSGLVAYPNPVEDKLYISSNSFNKIEVYDIMGQLQKTFLFENLNSTSSELDLSDLAKGNYYLNCISDNSTSKIKIVKH